MPSTPKIIGVQHLEDIDDDRVEWFRCIEEALLAYDVYTRAIIYPASVGENACRTLFNLTSSWPSLRLVIVGSGLDHLCHVQKSEWSEAIAYAENFL